MTKPGRVLCVIPDPMLRKLRRLLLEKAGFAVLAASSMEEAMELLARGGFDLLVIGCDVNGEARENLLRNCPKVPTVVLYCGGTPAIDADAFCDCLENPELLVSTVQYLLLKARSDGSGAARGSQGFTRILLDKGIAVSVCSFCYRFITYGSQTDELQRAESAHVCAEMREAYAGELDGEPERTGS